MNNKYNHEDIVNLYKSGKTAPEISLLKDIPKRQVYRILTKFGIRCPGRLGISKYSCQEDYFDEINTENKSYWLGFLLADGCVKCNNQFSLKLATIDIRHILKFKRDISSNHIFVYTKNEGVYGTSTLNISNYHFISSLREKGIVAHNKSIYGVSEELERHYWRGVIDGDGSIYSYKRKNNYEMVISLVGTDETVSKFKAFCSKYVETKSKIRSIGKNISVFRLTRIKAMKICSILYDNSNIYLDRKLERYKDYKNLVNYEIPV